MASINDVLASVDSPVKYGLIKRAIEVSPFLGLLNWESSPSIDHKLFVEGKLPVAAAREYNADFSAGTVAPDEPVVMQMDAFGSKLPMDPILMQETVRTGGDYKAKLRDQIARSIALDIKGRILGNVFTDSSLRSIYQWVNYWNSATNVIKIHGATNGEKISASGALARLVTGLSNLMIRVRPTFFATNATNLSVILTQIRAAALNSVYAAEFGVKMGTDAMGQPVPQVDFRGVPIIDLGEDSALASTMPFTEVDGSGTTASSIVAVKSNAENLTVITRFSDWFFEDEYIESGMRTLRIQMPYAVEARHPRSVGRYYGILAE